MAKEKKSTFSLDKYKTHDGERGSPEQWEEAMRQALLLDPKAKVKDIEKKLIKLGYRKFD